MTSSSSFLDLLFILLLATLAMLCDTTRLGAVDGAPAKAGGGAIAPIDADQVIPIYVTTDGLLFEQQTFPSASDLPPSARPGPDGCVLLIPADQSVVHQRVMTQWAEMVQQNWAVKLGVQRESPTP